MSHRYQHYLWGAVSFLFLCLALIPTPSIAQTTTPSQTFRVIVGVNSPFRPEGELAGGNAILFQRASIAIRQSYVTNSLNNMNIPILALRQFQTIPYMALEVDAAGLLALQLNPNVTSIVEDQLRYISTSSANNVVNAPEVWTAGYDGSGYAVAVLDTGVDFTHPSLSDKRLVEACFSNFYGDNYSACPNGQQTDFNFGAAMPPSSCASCNHGTHVAGIVAGNGAGKGIAHNTFRGVAPGANLMGINVFTLRGNGSLLGSYDSDQIAGLEYVYSLRNTYNIASVNLSLGGGRYYSEGECNNADNSYGGYYQAAVNNLFSVNIAVVASSGNESYINSLSAPACLGNVVSVGATDDSDVVASFSNSANFLDLLAPGVSISSTLLNGSYGNKSGTSMASPYVAGTWAIMRQAYPSDSVNTILNRLKTYGVLVTDGRNNIQTPRIDIANSIPTPGTIAFNAGSTTPSPSEGTMINIPINLTMGAGIINLPSPFTINLSYTGTATRNGDYTAPTSVTFSRSGGWSPSLFYGSEAVVPVTLLSDDVIDANETIVITLNSPAGIAITLAPPTSHTVTITNTNIQATGVINFDYASYNAGEYGEYGQANNILVPMTMSVINGTPNIPGPITVNLIYGASGGAIRNTDYTAPNSVSFSATSYGQGTYQALVPISILARSGIQGSRAFTITLASQTSPHVTLGGTQLSTIVSIIEGGQIKMTENELRYEIMEILEPSHQIDSVLPDFIAGSGINMVVMLDNGTVGTVTVNFTSQNGSQRVVFGAMTVNGLAAPTSYVDIINRELPELIINGMNNYIIRRTGANQRIEMTQIGISDITFNYLP